MTTNTKEFLVTSLRKKKISTNYQEILYNWKNLIVCMTFLHFNFACRCFILWHFYISFHLNVSKLLRCWLNSKKLVNNILLHSSFTGNTFLSRILISILNYKGGLGHQRAILRKKQKLISGIFQRQNNPRSIIPS